MFYINYFLEQLCTTDSEPITSIHIGKILFRPHLKQIVLQHLLQDF